MVELDPGHRLCVCHATPSDPWAKVCTPFAAATELRDAYGYVDADAVAYGHYHDHHILWLDSKLLVNVASVGLRTDGIASYTFVEHTDERWIFKQYTIPYDAQEESRLMIELDVPRPNQRS